MEYKLILFIINRERLTALFYIISIIKSEYLILLFYDNWE